MHHLFKYLKHLITATNQHGVHSPFVYNYLTKCLYGKLKFRASKSENVILQSIPFFSIEKFKIDAKDYIIENKIERAYGLKPSDKAPFDLIYLDYPKQNMFLLYEEKIHNDSMILIENIHKSRNASAFWETLKENKTITVSIDMFHCGVLFFRKEQVKEHFKIRI